MLNEAQQLRFITEIVGKAIETGKIKFEQPPLPQPIIQEAKKDSENSNVGLTIFDLLTCIMFTLNLMGVTNINWLVVFLPFVLPYVVMYGAMLGVKLWTNFNNRKNKKEDGESKAN